MVAYQWGVFWADLEPVKGSGQAGSRPVLVVSAEEANQALPIVAVLSLTSVKSGRKIYPIEAMLNANLTGLPKDSIAMAHQIRAISKERLGKKIGTIQDEGIKRELKRIIRTYLEL